MNILLELDTFRSDLTDEDGKVTTPDVLFAQVTGRNGDVTYSYHCPLFEEKGLVLADAHELMAMKVIHGLLTHDEPSA